MTSKKIREEKGSVFAKEDSCISYFDRLGEGGEYSFTVPTGKKLTITRFFLEFSPELKIEIWKNGELEKVFNEDSTEAGCPSKQGLNNSTCVATRAIFSSDSQVSIRNAGSPGFLLISGFLEDEI